MRHFGLLAVILGVGTPAIAQPATPSVYQDSIVVTASLAEERGEDLPASVTVLGAEEIEERQATDVLELLLTVPGAAPVQQGSAGKIASLFLRGTNSTQTLVLWNGVQLNDPSFGGFDWAFLTTDGVERVEVVRGPFSPLYGSEAIGGVVQVLTGAAGTGARLRLEGGGNGYARGGLSSRVEGEATRLDLAAHLRRGDGELPNDFYDGGGVVGRLGWAASPSLETALVGRWNDAEVGLPFDFFGNPSPRQVSTRESAEIALPVAWTRSSWQLEGQLSGHASDLLTRDPDAFFSSRIEGERRTARGVLTKRFSRGSWIAGGAEWEREEATTASSFGGGLDGDSQRTRSVFAQVHGSAGALSLDAGLRHDDNDTFGSETSLKLGAVWALARGARLRASYGEGFRAPSLGELFFPGFGNPDLEPERSEGVELGLELDRGPWRLDLAAFENDLENLIASAPPTFLPFNIGRARTRGAEAAAALTGDAVSLRLAATWLDTEDLATGEPLPRRPEWSASLALTWHPADAWTLNTVGRWVGERSDLGGVVLAGYTVVDLAAAWRVSRLLEPYARVENLFDETYEEAAGFPAPDRALVGGVALRF